MTSSSDPETPKNAVVDALKLALSGSQRTAVLSLLGDKPESLTGSEIASKTAAVQPSKDLSAEAIDYINLVVSLATFHPNDPLFVKALAEDPEVKNLRDVALKYDDSKLEQVYESQTGASRPIASRSSVSGGRAALTASPSSSHLVISALQQKIFQAEPSAVIQRMVRDSAIPMKSTEVRDGVVSFLSENPGFNIRKSSVLSLLNKSTSLEKVSHPHKDEIRAQLKTLQTSQSLVHTPAALPMLFRLNLTSAFQLSSVPEDSFLQRVGAEISEDDARAIHSHAIAVTARNNNILTSTLQTLRGSGLQAIDGVETKKDRLIRLNPIVKAAAPQVDLEQLFGSLDYCECDDCTSVYSPAAYFVELMQFLRNSNLNPVNPDGTQNTNTGKNGYEGTLLEDFLTRRPDVGNLELTCANSNTVLPYIDLANEVMESYIANLAKSSHASSSDPIIDVFNVADETSEELLASPQHTNYNAYCVLKSSLCPPKLLPYNQPLDSTRISLDYLGTSRFELLDIFRRNYTPPTKTTSGHVICTGDQTVLSTLHSEVLARATDSEYLRLSHEEYLILTKESFWPISYFNLTQGTDISVDDYQMKIGVKQVYNYWGLDYTSNDQMRSVDESNPVGLAFVKGQLLRRAGIQYSDLVAILETQFINPDYPQGKPLAILESIQFSYRFLQRLVDNTARKKRKRFAKLIKFLIAAQIALQPPDKCDCNCSEDLHVSTCQEVQDLCRWVYCWFDRIANLIVLESGEGPLLPWEGHVYEGSSDDISRSPRTRITTSQSATTPAIPIATLHLDGSITDFKTNSEIARVELNGQVFGPDGKLWIDSFPTKHLYVVPTEVGSEDYASIWSDGYLAIDGDPLSDTEDYVRITWTPQKDDCNIDLVRLRRLDGNSPKVDDYDRLHRFLRLWHKQGWTIDETDKVLTGLGRPLETPPDPDTPPSTSDPSQVDFTSFQDTCDDGSCSGDCEKPGCPCSSEEDNPSWNCGKPQVPAEISSEFIHQLVAFRNLLTLTGLEVVKLVTFWSEIDIYGEKSLYSQLFLTHNIIGIDPVFKPDRYGNYLTGSEKISAHIPVILSALRLKPEGLSAILAFRSIPDLLSLENVSILYRHALLAQALQVMPGDLEFVVGVFGDPFKDATSALDIFRLWNDMSYAGFTFSQMNFLLKNIDNPTRPVGPSQRTILKITKTIYDGLNALDAANPEITTTDAATDDQVTSNAIKIFDTSIAGQIVAFLDGATIYTSKAPANLSIQVPTALTAKLKYNPTGLVTTTGLLTPAEMIQAQALSTDPDWTAALGRFAKQAVWFVNTALSGVFAGDLDDATEKLITPGDDASSGPSKRLYFLQQLIPFLKDQLANRLVIDTLAGIVGLSSDVTETLLAHTLTTGSPPVSALASFKAIKSAAPDDPTNWHGYLVVPSSDTYVFAQRSNTEPPSMILDGRAIPLGLKVEDPLSGDIVWFSDGIKLVGGRLFELQISGPGATQLQWQTARSPLSAIPSSALLPDYTTTTTSALYTLLYNAGMIISGFNLTSDEITFFQTHPADFSGFDLNKFDLPMWRRLVAYTKFRKSLPQYDTTLLQFFIWANYPDNPGDLSLKIASITPWLPTDIAKLISSPHFNLTDPKYFKNEINLIRMQKAWTVAQKVNADIDSLFSWAVPIIKFWDLHAIDTSIRNAIRAKYSLSDWEQVVQPLNDKLRTNQQTALAAYLTVHPSLTGIVTDADSLFEYFLIDVQMCPCMQTSRIKQATSSIQLFIQRCLMRLEGDDANIANIDRNRWTYMQKYRVWQAAVQVFLWPENYIVPSLRDDKSPFYLEFESELLQKDISLDTTLQTVKNYLFKVDQVASLQVVGLYNETIDPSTQVLHIVGRTRHAPFFYYYRNFNTKYANWTPWSQVQVDIPNTEVQVPGKVLISGAYVIPFVFQGRLMLGIPQFSKKTIPAPVPKEKTMMDLGGVAGGPPTQPQELLEIKMGYSELQDSKWTQKQISTTAIYAPFNSFSSAADSPDDPTTAAQLQFVVRTGPNIKAGTQPAVYIDCYVTPVKKATADKLGIPVPVQNPFPPPSSGRFALVGGVLDKQSTFVGPVVSTGGTVFSYMDTTYSDTSQGQPTGAVWRIHPFQSETDPGAIDSWNDAAPYVDHMQSAPTTSFIDYSIGRQVFNNTWSNSLLGTLTGTENLDQTYAALETISPLADFLGIDTTGQYNELKRPNSIYSWEVGFHMPMALVDKLLNTQQFDLALKVLGYVFDPLAQGTAQNRFWRWTAFANTDPKETLIQMFESLKPNKPDTQYHINEWRDKPFLPHAVARSRPLAYMKYVAMKYIEVLIAYGDYYFNQNTLETIPMALQCYILAGHIYGPRGQRIPKRGKKAAQTYNSLVDKWDAFSNAMVQLELQFPFSNQIQFPIGSSNGVAGLANIFGFATTLYFCIPNNQNLTALRDTIDDRLFKIRHCEDIKGVFRILPLYEPPIDPMLLVQATAQGLSLSSILNDLNATLPNYRFPFLLAKAIDMCNELKALGAAFLGTKEKSDGEALQVLRTSHELSIANLVMSSRQLQLTEAQAAIDTLNQNRRGAQYRMQHNLQLLGADISTIPGPTDDFNELNDNIEAPQQDSGLKLIPSEIEEISKSNTAADLSLTAGGVEALVALMEIFPNFVIAVEPWGLGTSENWGPSFQGKALTAIARGIRVYAEYLQHGASNAARTTSIKRFAIGNSMGANIAGYELKSIDKQILQQSIHVSMANQEINTQQAAIDHAEAVRDFLANKYTNTDLYNWMSDSIKTLYRQTYDLAYGWAKKAEILYQFERSLDSSAKNAFIDYGYFDPGHDGLLAGERLFQGLKALEAAYNETRGYDFEVSKFVSLRLTSPLALLKLRETGSCKFAIPEVLFDMDFPGHYQRKIKSISMTIPCVVGPYTSVNATLRLIEHKYRNSSIATSASDYAEQTDQTDPRFSTINIPITAIAISTAQNDAGLFELNFRDERYLPFEGAGAVSKWSLDLPPFAQFSYSSITDAVMHIRYTSVDGGNALQGPASDSVTAFLKQMQDMSSDTGLFSIFDVKNEFATAWYAAMMTPAQGVTTRTLTLSGLSDRLPIWTRGKKVVATDVTVLFGLSAGNLHAADVTLAQSQYGFEDQPAVDEGLLRVGIEGGNVPMDGDWVLTIGNTTAVFTQMWLMVRYVLKS